MRTHSIVKSLESGQSRFRLCHQVFNAIRKLHKPANRIQDTANDALERLAEAQHQVVSAEPKNGKDAALEAGREVANDAPAHASVSEVMAGIPPAAPSSTAGNDSPEKLTELWLQNR